jgi:serine/threonine protein kinase
MNLQTQAQADNQFRYKLLTCIGEGAFGQVVRAEDCKLERAVAIKKYHASINAVSGLLPSITIWSRLNHPCISQVVDCFTINDRLQVVMTYCEGGSLFEYLESTPSDFRTTGLIFLRIADAIGFMHNQKVIHRDIKLGNIMMDGNGEPILIDLDRCIRLDSAGESLDVGTIGYLAPELSKVSGQSSFATDIFALGIVLFELLTDTRVEQMTQEQRIEFSRTPKKLTVHKSIPNVADWNALIAKATHEDSSRRYLTVQSFADDVSRAIELRPIQARRTSRLELAYRWARRKPMLAGLCCVIILVLLGGSIASLQAWSKAKNLKDIVDHSATQLAVQIRESNRSQAELVTLVKENDESLRAAESAEKEQSLATQAVEVSKQNLQAELSKSEQLTSQLQLLLTQARESAKALEVSNTKSVASAVALAEAESERERTKYKYDFSSAWKCVEEGRWGDADALAKTLAPSRRGVEYQMLTDAILNQLNFPKKIELGITEKIYDSFSSDLTQRYWSEDRLRLLSLAVFDGKSTFAFSDQRVEVLMVIRAIPDAKLVALLNDGSIIGRVGNKYSLWTYSPAKFNGLNEKNGSRFVETVVQIERIKFVPDWQFEIGTQAYAKRRGESIRNSNITKNVLASDATFTWQGSEKTKALDLGIATIQFPRRGDSASPVASPDTSEVAIGSDQSTIYAYNDRLWFFNQQMQTHFPMKLAAKSVAIDRNDMVYVANRSGGAYGLLYWDRRRESGNDSPKSASLKLEADAIVSAPVGWDSDHLYSSTNNKIARHKLPLASESQEGPWFQLDAPDVQIVRFLPLSQDRLLMTVKKTNDQSKHAHLLFDRNFKGYFVVKEIGAYTMQSDGSLLSVDDQGYLRKFEIQPLASLIERPFRALAIKQADLLNYQLQVIGTAKAELTETVTGISVSVSELSNEPWHVQLVSKPIDLVEGATYQVFLRAKSPTSMQARVEATKNGEDYANIGLHVGTRIESIATDQQFEFVATKTGKAPSRISLLLGLEKGIVSVERFEMKLKQ